jgi:multiple sugar transport system substrate-binding protein
MTPVYQEVEKKHGKKIDLAHKSTFNPKSKKYFAFSDSYVPIPATTQGLAGPRPASQWPDTWDDLRTGAKKISDKKGNPCRHRPGPGARHQHGRSARCLWSFGGAEQDERATSRSTSKQTIERSSS